MTELLLALVYYRGGLVGGLLCAGASRWGLCGRTQVWLNCASFARNPRGSVFGPVTSEVASLSVEVLLADDMGNTKGLAGMRDAKGRGAQLGGMYGA